MTVSLPYLPLHLKLKQPPSIKGAEKPFFFGQLNPLSTNDADCKIFSHLSGAGVLLDSNGEKLLLNEPKISDIMDARTLWGVFNYFQNLPLENMANHLEEMAYEGTDIDDEDAAYGFARWDCHDIFFITDGDYWIYWRKDGLQHELCFYDDEDEYDENPEVELDNLICVKGPVLDSHHTKMTAQVHVQKLISLLPLFETIKNPLTFQS